MENSEEKKNKKKTIGKRILITIVILIVFYGIGGIFGRQYAEKIKQDSSSERTTSSSDVKSTESDYSSPDTTESEFTYGTYNSIRYVNDWCGIQIDIPDGYRIAYEEINIAEDSCPFALVDDDEINHLSIDFCQADGYSVYDYLDEYIDSFTEKLKDYNVEVAPNYDSVFIGEQLFHSKEVTVHNGNNNDCYYKMYVAEKDDILISIYVIAADYDNYMTLQNSLK